MSDCIVVLNCGSSSIKFVLSDTNFDPLPRAPVWDGTVEGTGTEHPTATEAGAPAQVLELDAAQPYHAALMHIRQRVERRLEGRWLKAVTHRVVYGGTKYFAPVHVNAGVLSDPRNYIPLASLHQPFALEAIEALLLGLSGMPQVACFDTTFHHALPQVKAMLPLPYIAQERDLRCYGFHGLSYEYMSIALLECHGDIARERTIVAHLGSGASLCVMIELKSMVTTMGFSVLEGLMMGTRCGSLDPGTVLYMMETEHLSPAQVGHVLHHESGLLGVSGLSSDPRGLTSREADNPHVQATLALYVRRIVRETGVLVTVLGGLDLLVFMAGIGEHNVVLRERVVGGLDYLGASLDGEANQAHVAIISSSASRIRVAVGPTNEEWVAARHVVQRSLQRRVFLSKGLDGTGCCHIAHRCRFYFT